MDFIAPSILGLLTAIAIIYTPLRHIGQYFETIFHELGHALVGVLLGKRLHGFKLYANGEGVTVTLSNGYGIRGMLTQLAGYPAPVVFSTTMLILSYLGYYQQTMIAIIVACAYMLIFARSFFTVVPLALLGGFAWLGLYIDQPFYYIALIALLCSILVIRGIDSLIKLYRYLPEGSDVYMIKSYVGGNQRFWVALMFIITTINSFLVPYIVVFLIEAILKIQIPVI